MKIVRATIMLSLLVAASVVPLRNVFSIRIDVGARRV
jgi:hypothetical protein